MLSLQQKLNQLSLTTMSRQLDQTVNEAAARNLSLVQALESLADSELEARNNRSIERRFRLSRLHARYSIDSFQFKHHKVGGDPLRQGPPYSRDDFHAIIQDQFRVWPNAMNATSTHDTKRSEDVRARINVLSELPGEWNKRLERWSRWNRERKVRVGGIDAPAPSEEVLIYQTALGAWPLEPESITEFVERLKAFLVKAAREAKTHSDWLQPNHEHEDAVARFAEGIFTPSECNRFLPDFLRFQERIAFHGALNALSQTLIKIASPGVPDFYQGTELWDFSLVDPDNRRPVDYQKRIAMLDRLRKQESESRRSMISGIISGWKDGSIKLYLTDKALDFRRAHADLFLAGEYLPLTAIGPRQDNLNCAWTAERGFLGRSGGSAMANPMLLGTESASRRTGLAGHCDSAARRRSCLMAKRPDR